MTQISQVKKRSGDVVPFDQHRIYSAISKAFASVGNNNIILVQKISDQVVNVMNNKFAGKGIPSVEEIQDIVETLLITNNLPQIAKNFIVYRYEHSKSRGTTLDTEEAEVREDAEAHK